MELSTSSSSTEVAEPPEPPGRPSLPKTKKRCAGQRIIIQTYQLNGSIPTRAHLEEMLEDELKSLRYAREPYDTYGGAIAQLFYFNGKIGSGVAFLEYKEGRKDWFIISRGREGYTWKDAEFFTHQEPDSRTIVYGLREKISSAHNGSK